MTLNTPLGQELKSVQGNNKKGKYCYNHDFYPLWALYTVHRSHNKYLETIMIHR